MDNTSTLIQLEEKQAPLNQKTKCIEVNISQCLSCTITIEVPDDFDETDSVALEELVVNEIMLPSDCVTDLGYNNWIVDDFCVI